ncbi:unnamed protein product [Urochloa decumbens]|uniref:Uncharacterized protein n=1 Tax=Urochloa decumbens TaxID=240449 RepID=A0ABC9DFA8_9POAL
MAASCALSAPSCLVRQPLCGSKLGKKLTPCLPSLRDARVRMNAAKLPPGVSETSKNASCNCCKKDSPRKKFSQDCCKKIVQGKSFHRYLFNFYCIQVEVPRVQPKLSEPFLGFTQTAEIWNSRACMMGLIGTFIVELVLNKGVLQIIGVEVGKGLDLPL